MRLPELAGDLVPSVDWFVYALLSKEAVRSAQIEGTEVRILAVRHQRELDYPK